METLYLSRKNLEILLSKLNRQLDGEKTECTIIKHKSDLGPYKQSMDVCIVQAVENLAYYSSQERKSGVMFGRIQNLQIGLELS